jgi:predicted SAM-dependent methyltransferase
MVRLHLGCGMKYLDGYLNIDYPHELHSVQDKSVADYHCNIIDLRYEKSSIEEIRLHHVYEHFSRPIALSLIACWNSWLKVDGHLRIEVPDFKRSALKVLSPLTSDKEKKKSIRHLFGSHEAIWAYHLEGYAHQSLSEIFKIFGFSIEKSLKNSWKGTYNIEIIGSKNRDISLQEAKVIGKNYLFSFLVDNNQSEMKLLETWLEIYNNQLIKGFAFESYS